MAEDFVQTVALYQRDVDAALKGLGERITAVSMSNASHGADVASLRRIVERIDSQQSMGDTQVTLMYTQVNKISASVGMARAEIAGANKLYLEAQAEVIEHLIDIYRRVTTFCFLSGAVLVLLALLLWLKP